MTTGDTSTNGRRVIQRGCLLVVSAISVLLALELASNLYYSLTQGGLFYVRSAPEISPREGAGRQPIAINIDVLRMLPRAFMCARN